MFNVFVVLSTGIMAAPAGQQEDVPMVAAANLNAADVIVPAGNPPDSSLETRSSTVTADTHSNEWALAPDEAHGGSPEFVARVKAFVKQVIQEHGSPFYYLKFHLKLDPTSNEEKTQSLKLRSDYASWLWETFPESDQIAYHHNGLLPSCKESDMGSTLPLCIHVTSLGYDKACSAKEPPGEDVFTRLVDRYLIDGFVTASEPGWVVQPEALAHLGLDDLPRPGAGWTRGQLAVGSLGYIKFWGRVCSLHALLLWCKNQGINLAQENPLLYSSLLTIYCYHVPQDTRSDEAILNLVRSTQGSIRRGPNTIGMVLMMFNLNLGQGGAYQDFIRRWNKKAGGQGVVGKRATAMKFIMELAPHDVIHEIFKHNEKMPSGAGVWTDDNIASKKLFPGHSFGAGRSKKRPLRLKVTAESMKLMVMHIQNAHETTPATMRKRPDIQRNCHTAEMAAVLYSLGQEAMTVVPVKESDIRNLGSPN